MCDPITAGIALTVASVGANSFAQSQITKARDSAMEAERIRQRGLDQEADALNLKSQDRYKDWGAKQEETGQNLADYFNSNQVPAEQRPQDIPAPTNNVVVAEQQKQTAKAKAFGQQQGQALGNLRAFGDLLGDTSRAQARDATQIGQIGNFKQGSSNVLGMELDAANQAGGSMKLLGDVLGGFGNVSLNAGLSGKSLFGGKSPVSVSAPIASGAGLAKTPLTAQNLRTLALY